MSAGRFVFGFVLAAFAAPTMATAQNAIGSEWEGVPEFVASDELFTFELRLGAYQANLGAAGAVFRGDLGPILELELDVHVFRVPYLGPIAIGGHLGWATRRRSALARESGESVAPRQTSNAAPSTTPPNSAASTPAPGSVARTCNKVQPRAKQIRIRRIGGFYGAVGRKRSWRMTGVPLHLSLW